jgi:hypothetical protein
MFWNATFVFETTPLFETHNYLKPLFVGVSNSSDAHSS